MEGSNPNFHSCYGTDETQLHTSLPQARPMKGTQYWGFQATLPPRTLQKLNTENANGLTDQEGQ